MLINCPECGHEISDRAQCCPHCGCPISATSYDFEEELGTQNNSQKFAKAKLYYQDEVCNLSSDVWEFNGQTIPVKSVASVSTEHTSFPYLGIYFLLFLFVMLLIFIFAESSGLIAFDIILMIVLVAYLILRYEYYLVITNTSGTKTQAVGSKDKAHIMMLYRITQDILRGEKPKTPEEYESMKIQPEQEFSDFLSEDMNEYNPEKAYRIIGEKEGPDTSDIKFRVGQLVIITKDERQFRIASINSNDDEPTYYSAKFNSWFAENEIMDFNKYWRMKKGQ